jgi:hypothetical protein
MFIYRAAEKGALRESGVYVDVWHRPSLTCTLDGLKMGMNARTHSSNLDDDDFETTLRSVSIESRK